MRNSTCKTGLALALALTACGTETITKEGPPGVAVPLPAPEARANVSGVVLDARSGRPLVGVRIRTDPPSAETTTGEGGIYQLTELTPGAWAVLADLDGYEPNQVDVTVQEGRGAIADLRLSASRPMLEVEPRTLAFGSDLTELRFTVRNVGQPVTALAWSLGGLEPWLSASPASGALDGGDAVEVVVTANRASLADRWGNYGALLNVVSDGGDAIVAVRLDHVNPSQPHLSYTYEVIDFGLSSQRATLTIENDGTGDLTWTSTTNVGWLSTSPASGSLAAGRSEVLELIADRGLLVAGREASGFLAFVSNSVIDDAVPLRIHIAEPHVHRWSVPTTPLDFGDDRIDRGVRITNTGSDLLDFTAFAAPPWLRVVPAAGTLLPGNALTVYVLIDRGALPSGAFSSSVRFSSRVGTETVSLSGRNVPRPILSHTRTVLFTDTAVTSTSALFWLTNSGTGTVRWTVTSTMPWLTIVDPPSGTSPYRGCFIEPRGLQGCGEALRIRLDRSRLPGPGYQTGSIYVSNPDDGSTTHVPVRIYARDYRWADPSPAPPTPRRFAAMAYDPIRDRAILFGGLLPSADGSGGDVISDETWELDGAGWRLLSPATRPPAREDAQLVWDARRGVLVLIGGQGLNRQRLGDTWEFDGNDWVLAVANGTPASPVRTSYGLSSHATSRTAVFDPNLGRVVLYGGLDACVGDTPPADLDLWIYDGASWVPSLQANLPATCDPLLIHWQGRLHLQGTFGQFRATRTAFTEDATLGWRQAGVLPITHGVASPILVDPDSQTIWELSGGRHNYSVTEAIPALTVGLVQPPAPLPAAVGIEAFYYQFGAHAAQPFGVSFLPFEGRRGHAAALDTRRHRLIGVTGDCGRATRGRGSPWTPCADARTLVLQMNGDPAVDAPTLGLSVRGVDFGASDTERSVTVSNTGSGVLDWSAVPPLGYFAEPDFGRLPAGQSVSVRLSVDRSALAPGNRTDVWALRSDGGAASVTMSVVVP